MNHNESNKSIHFFITILKKKSYRPETFEWCMTIMNTLLLWRTCQIYNSSLSLHGRL